MSEDTSFFNDDQKMLSMAAICDWLGIRKRTLQTWRQSGSFPPPDLAKGKTLRWRRSTIDRWLDDQTPGA